MGSESLKLPNLRCLKPHNSLNESAGSGQRIHQPPPPATSSTSIDRAALPAGACQVLLHPGSPDALIVHIFLSKTTPEPALDRRPCSPPSLARPCQDHIHRGQPEVEFRDREGLSPHSVQTLGWFSVDKVVRGYSLCLQTCDIHFWGCLK